MKTLRPSSDCETRGSAKAQAASSSSSWGSEEARGWRPLKRPLCRPYQSSECWPIIITLNSLSLTCLSVLVVDCWLLKARGRHPFEGGDLSKDLFAAPTRVVSVLSLTSLSVLVVECWRILNLVFPRTSLGFPWMEFIRCLIKWFMQGLFHGTQGAHWTYRSKKDLKAQNDRPGRFYKTVIFCFFRRRTKMPEMLSACLDLSTRLTRAASSITLTGWYYQLDSNLIFLTIVIFFQGQLLWGGLPTSHPRSSPRTHHWWGWGWGWRQPNLQERPFFQPLQLQLQPAQQPTSPSSTSHGSTLQPLATNASKTYGPPPSP